MVQTKYFLDHLHETLKGKLVNTLDNERWTQCDVSRDRQEGLDKLASGKSFLQKGASENAVNSTSSSSSSSSSDATIGVKISEHENNSSHSSSSSIYNSNNIDTSDQKESKTSSKKKEAKPAVVEGTPYRVVWSAMLLVEITLNYLEVSTNFPAVTTDIISKIVELFKLFDVRTKQLVLGAQAIQSAARLKNISAKHLSITAQVNTLI